MSEYRNEWLNVLVAAAAPAALGATAQLRGGKTVGKVIVDGPGGKVAAGVGAAAVAARLGVDVA